MPKKYRKPRNQGKKKFRKNFQRRVEGKRRESAEVQIRNSTNGQGTAFSANYPDTTKATALDHVTAVNLLPLRSFYRMSQGDRENQMNGCQIYSKNLYLKGEVTAGSSVRLSEMELYFVTGWVQDKLGYTDFSTPSVATATRSDLESFVLAQVKQHFDQSVDQLRYREAKKDNIKITKYQRLVHPMDADNTAPIEIKGHWPVNRKTTYTKCVKLAGNNDLIQNSSSTPGVTIDMTDSFKEDIDALGGDVGGWLPLESWLPFALIYNRSAPSDHGIKVAFNDIHYFTDA